MEDKGNNNTGTAGAHVREIVAAQDNTGAGATSYGSIIGAQVFNVTKNNVPSTQSVHELLVAHPVDDPIWDHTDSCDISIDTVNSAEAMAGSHIAGQQYIFRRTNTGFDYIEHIVDVASDIIEKDGLY